MLAESPASDPKAVSILLQSLIKCYEEHDADRLVERFTSLIKGELQLSSDRWRQSFNFGAYQNVDNMAPLFLNMLESIKQWMAERTESKEALFHGFRIYVTLLDLGLKYLNEMGERNAWFVRVIMCFIRNSKKVLMEAKQAGGAINKPTEKLLETLFHQLREFKSTRNMEPKTKKDITLLIDNLQVSIYFSLHDYHKSERTLDLINRDFSSYNPNHLNNFYFQYGKVALIGSHFLDAEARFENIRIYRPSQERLIMRYLIPCKIFLGKMSMNPAYPEYLPLIEGIIRGDFRIFEKAIQRFQKLWIKRGIYLVMERMRVLVWRNLIKRIVNIANTIQVDLEVIVKGVRLMGGQESIEECMCIISNLIYEGYIKGYIYHSESKKLLAIKKSAAFPSFAKVEETKDKSRPSNIQ